jgi:hypothetical protein
MPVLDFNANAYAQMTKDSGLGSSGKKYAGPRYQLSGIANAAASLGSLLTFPVPAPNSSYELNFMGPALQCSKIEGTLRAQFVKNISDTIECNIESKYPADDACRIQTLYAAWAPNTTDAVSFSGSTSTNQIGFQGNTIGQLGANPGDSPAAIFFASQPTLENSAEWNLLNCSLFNASYHIAVNFTGGVQTVNIKKNLTNGVGFNNLLDIIGSASANGKDPITGVDALMSSTLNQFAYQSVMDVFGRLVVGQISVFFRNGAGGFNFSTQKTSVMTTSLAQSADLGSIFQVAEKCSNGHDNACNLKSTNANLNVTVAKGVLSLQDAAEQLFENITLSLFSNDMFLYVFAPFTSQNSNVPLLTKQTPTDHPAQPHHPLQLHSTLPKIATSTHGGASQRPTLQHS